jgi:hypothetical protein
MKQPHIVRQTKDVDQTRRPYGLHIHPSYIVSGLCRRSIRVVLLPFDGLDTRKVSDDELVVIAAQFAAKRGWKTIIIRQDFYYGEYAMAYNHAMWKRMLDSELTYDDSFGKTLCFVGASRTMEEIMQDL